jgi:hypothetical protein
MSHKSNYPDWVLKHKPKGVYVNKKGDTYYLYKAHCVYDKATGKNRRVSDGYIGRVTEKDGFIPSKEKVSGDIFVYEFGFPFVLSFLLLKSYSHLKKSFPTYADSICSLAIINFLKTDYDSTALFTIYPKTKIKHFSDDTVISRSITISNQLIHFVNKLDDFELFSSCLSSLHLVKVNASYYFSSISPELTNALITLTKSEDYIWLKYLTHLNK